MPPLTHALTVFAAFTGGGFPGAFESPREFTPSRWRDAKEGSVPQFFPFSGGTRDCIGQQLAVLQAKLSIAVLLHRFTFGRLPGAKPVDGHLSLTLVPHGGVHCTVAPRGR